jgi:predicted NBD/HSP70 family sugar kinase
MQIHDLATGSPALMRRVNASRVLRELRESGPLSRAGLARLTGLSKPTVNGVMDDLLRSGFVTPVDAPEGGPGRPGRPAQLFAFRGDLGHVLGVDIGADKLLLMLADATGRVVAQARRTTRAAAARGLKGILDELVPASEALLAEAGVAETQLLRVVAGTPGVVSSEGVVTQAPQLRDWEGLNLRSALESIFPCPVHVDREVHLSLLAERWQGVARDLDDALYVQLGIGVGAALLIGGQVYRGADGGAGEIGLMPIGGARPAAPGFGPFESATGGVGIAARGRELAERDEGAALLERAGDDPSAIDAAMVFAAAADGDAAAAQIVDGAIGVLAEGVAALVCALNPHTVIVSGGLSRAGDALVEPLRERVAELVPFPPRFLVSTLGDEAVALGAVRRATEVLERTMFNEPELAGGTR